MICRGEFKILLGAKIQLKKVDQKLVSTINQTKIA